MSDLTLLQVAQAVGLSLGAGVLVAAAAAIYRWYFRQRVPFGVALLLDGSVVTLYLNTRVALGEAIAGRAEALTLTSVSFNLVVFVLAGVLVPAAWRAGDRVGIQLLAATGTRELEGEVGRLVTTVGRAVTVELPDEIDDIDGYDPVEESAKRALAGKTLIFPRRLTVEELRDRVVTRLKDDYEVGFVDVELEADGTASYLALGRRTAGIGPTLPPGAAAVAVHADPPNAAAAGDLVQVWRVDGDDRERITTAEIRGVADDTVTLALDEYDATALAGGEYRLLTLPHEPDADRQFAALLRNADETMAVATVAAGSDLDGMAVADVAGTVVAVRDSERLDAIPSAERTLAAGNTVYVVARPDAARRLDAAATAS